LLVAVTPAVTVFSLSKLLKANLPFCDLKEAATQSAVRFALEPAESRTSSMSPPKSLLGPLG
jgi:hypothetical protein